MKKIIYFFAILLFCACSHGLERKAKDQMEKTMKELAKDPSSVSFNDMKVMFDNDSICIIQFKLSAKNGFGAITSSECEYIYLIEKFDSTEIGCAREIVLYLKDDESIMSKARKEYQKKDWKKGTPLDLKSEDEKKAYFIYQTAYIASIFKGRKVDYDRNDIENW